MRRYLLCRMKTLHRISLITPLLTVTILSWKQERAILNFLDVVIWERKEKEDWEIMMFYEN